MRELNNQPHSRNFYALLFCFSQHKILAFIQLNQIRRDRRILLSLPKDRGGH